MATVNTDADTSLLRCPITGEKFRDPVVAGDGHTYEREAIVHWLNSGGGTSPMTRQPLNADRLIPNLRVKELVEADLDETPRKKKYQFKLDEDIKQLDHIFTSHGKIVDAAEWLKKTDGIPIVLMTISGTQALKEANYYVTMSMHPHVVRTYGLVDNPTKEVMLVQERAPKGDLLQLLKRREQPPTIAVLREMFIQIASAMSFLAHNKLVHGDLACRNILVFKFDEESVDQNLVKVTDFGLSRASSIYKCMSTSAATTMNVIPYRYAAPEILENPDVKEHYTERSDMYSMGVLMCEAFSPRGKQPWSDNNDDMQVMKRVIRGERLPRPLACSEDMWKIIENTMSHQASDRPTFACLHRKLIECAIHSWAPDPPKPAPRICDTIKYDGIAINLPWTYLDVEEIGIIAEKLKKNNSVLRLDFTGTCLADQGATFIAEMLQSNKKITKLLVPSSNISSIGAKRLAQALKINQTLVELRVDHNPLLDDGVQAICEALETNQKLATLSLRDTGMTTFGVKSIAEMLCGNATLTKLDIGNNKIMDDSAVLIANALEINESLNWLNMVSDDVSDKGAFVLAQGIIAHKRKFNYFAITAPCLVSNSGRDAIENALIANATAKR